MSGARQVGKTTLVLQAIEALLADGIPRGQILYLTLDHPILRLVGIDELLEVHREAYPAAGGPDFVFVDEIQHAGNWQTWLKHQVDFAANRRLVVTGSAVPITTEGQESGVGRWHTLVLPTLSFGEYLELRGVHPNADSPRPSLAEVASWRDGQFLRLTEVARLLVPHFFEYLLRGGFPQTAVIDDVSLAQKLLREDIVDKVLRRDMTALYGVRRVLELEKTFLFLCLHDTGLLDMTALCSNLSVRKPTVQSFIEILESSHLLCRLPPLGYGKEVLRARYKVYLADAAIAGSVLLKGRNLIEDATRLGAAVEGAVFRHLRAQANAAGGSISYWRDSRSGHEVNFVVEGPEGVLPIEVKHVRSGARSDELLGLRAFVSRKHVQSAVVITREASDCGLSRLTVSVDNKTRSVPLVRIPAALACLWLSDASHGAGDSK